MKTCSKCGVEKELGEFGRTSKARGRKPLAICKGCETARILAWREANPEKSAAIHARHYLNNTATVSARVAQWHKADIAKNPEKYAARSREWKRANPEKCAQYMMEWKRENRAYCTAQQQQREAKKRSATPAWANQFFIEEAYELARLRTQQKTGGVDEWQVDHIVPLKSKLVCGLHVENNLQVIPAVDNRSKNNRHWPDMPTL